MAKGRLDGQVAWITGAASGMGEATAELFAAEGAAVAVVDINKKLGPDVVERISRKGGRANFVACDVSKERDVNSCMRQIVEHFGSLSIIVNNAAVTGVGLLHEMTEQEWDRQMDVNVKSIFFSVKYGLEHLAKQEHSYIVNIGSISSYVGQASTPIYTTTKGAVLLLSKSIALDYAHLGLRCNCICPGITDTPLLRNVLANMPDGDQVLRDRLRRVPLNRAMTPDDIARSALFLCCEDSAGITGESLLVDGGYLAAAEWDADKH